MTPRQKLEQLYIEKHTTYLKLMQRRTGAIMDAEDIVQTAFERSLRFIDKFDINKSELVTWFGAILNNAYVDWERNSETVLPHSLAPEETTEELEAQFELPDMRKELARYIDNYPNVEHRDVLMLTLIERFSDRDAADITSMTHTNVRKIKHDFKRRITDPHRKPNMWI